MGAAVLTGPLTWQAGWECITIGAEEACNHHTSCLAYMHSLRPRAKSMQAAVPVKGGQCAAPLTGASGCVRMCS